MFPNKTQVDKHVSNIVSKLKDVKEKHSRGYQFAKLYYDVRDYSSATKWLDMFSRVKDHYAPALELKAKILEAQGDKVGAFESYKRAYELDKTQSPLLFKICELSFEVEGGSEGARFWVDKLDSVYPNHKMLFRMKEKIYQSSPKKNPDDLGKLLQQELMENPTDANLRVKYVSFISEHTSRGREQALRYCIESEQSVPHPTSPHWYRCLLNVLEAKSGGNEAQSDANMERIRLHALNSALRMSVADGGATLHDCQALLYRFDSMVGRANLDDVQFTEEMEAWLHLHALLIATKLIEKGSSLSPDDSALVYLAFMAFKDLGLSERFGSNVISTGDHQLSGPLMNHLQALACRRRAEAGHMLLSLLGERSLDECLALYDAHRPEGQAALRKLLSELYGKAGSTLSFENSALMIAVVDSDKGSLEWDDMFDMDLACSVSCIADGHVIVWLLADSLRNNCARTPGDIVRASDASPDIVLSLSLEIADRCFPGLPTSPAFGPAASSDQQHSPETLSRLDVLVFLLLSSCAVGRAQDSPPRPLSRCSPAEVLASSDQRRWWSALVESCAGPVPGQGSVGQRRLVLQRGLDAIRLRGRAELMPGIVAAANLMASLLRLARLQTGLLDRASDALAEWADHSAAHVLDRVSALRRSREAGRVPLSTPKRASPTSPFFPAWPPDGDAALSAAELDEVEFSALITRAEAAEALDDWERAQGWWERAVRLSEEPGNWRAAGGLSAWAARHRLARTFIRLFESRDEDEEARISVLERAKEILVKLKDTASRSNADSLNDVRRDLDLVTSYSSELSCSHLGDLDPVISGQLNTHSSELASRSDQNGSRSLAAPLRTPIRPNSTPDSSRRSIGRDTRLESQLRTLTLALERVANQQPENNRQLVETNVRLTNQLIETNRQLTETQSRLRETRRANSQLKAKMQELQLALMQATSINPRNPYAAASGWSQQWMTPQAAHVLAHIQQQQQQQQQFHQLQQQQQQQTSTLHQSSLSAGQYGEEDDVYGEEFYVYDEEDDEVEVEVLNQQGVTEAGLKLAQQQRAGDFSLPSPGFFNATTSPPTKPGPAVGQRATPNTIITPPTLASFQKTLAGKPTVSQVAKPSPPKPNPSQAFGSFTSATSAQSAAPKPVMTAAFVRPTDPASASNLAANPIGNPVASPTANPVANAAAKTSTSTADAPKMTTKSLFGFNAAKSSSPPQVKAFSLPSPSPPAKPGFGLLFGTSAPKPPSPVKSPGATGGPEEFEPDVHFEPALESLPDLVEATTGEENERKLFEERARLFRFHKPSGEWKTRGTGDLRILADDTAQRFRIVMRRDQVKKLCANHTIAPEMRLQPFASAPHAVMWAARDFADGAEGSDETLAVRFKDEEKVNAFQKIFQECQSKIKATRGKDKSQPKTTEKPAVPAHAAAPDTTSLLDRFKLKSSEWKCDRCCAINKDSDTACVSCATSRPKPATAKTAPADSTTSLFDRFKLKASEWQCDGCYITNKDSDASCIVCATPQPKPAAVKSAAAAPATATAKTTAPKEDAATAALRERFQPKPGEWKCDMCLIMNKAEFQACAACNSPKPGAAPSQASGFTFGCAFSGPTPTSIRFGAPPPVSSGSSQTSGNVSNSGGSGKPILFGAPPPTAAPTGPLRFGAPGSASTSSATGSSPIRFGTPGSTATNAATGSSPIRFGTTANVAAGAATGNSPIRFGAPGNTTTSAATGSSPIRFGAPGNVATSAAIGSSPIRFGASPNAVTGTAAGASPIRFGTAANAAASAAAGAPGPIRFGSMASTTTGAAIGSAPVRFATPGSVAPSSSPLRFGVNTSPSVPAQPSPVTGSSPIRFAGTAAAAVTTSPVRFAAAAAAAPSTAGSQVGAASTFVFGNAPVASAQPAAAFSTPSTAAPARPFLFGDSSKSPPTATVPTNGAKPAQGSFVFGSKANQPASGSPTSAWTSFNANKSPEAAQKAADKPFGGVGASAIWSPKGGSSPTFTSRAARKDSQSEDEVAEDEGDNLYFKPVLEKLPEKVEISTGEEGEQSLFERRAKLFRWAKEEGGGGWKERGVGQLRILRHPGSGRARVVMRRDAVLKVCCNHPLAPGMTLKPMAGSAAGKSWTWFAVDFAEGQESNELFAVRFKTDADAADFAKAFNEAKATGGAGESPAKMTPLPAAATAATTVSRQGDGKLEVELVRVEPEVSAEQAQRARRLLLPDHFYAFENAPTTGEVDSDEEDKLFAAFHARLAADKVSSAAPPAKASLFPSTASEKTPAVPPASTPGEEPPSATKSLFANMPPVLGKASSFPSTSASEKTPAAPPASTPGEEPPSATKSLFANMPPLLGKASASQPVFGAGSALPSFKSLASGTGETFSSGQTASQTSFKALAASAPSEKPGEAPKAGDSMFKWAGAGTRLFGHDSGEGAAKDAEEDKKEEEEEGEGPTFEPVIPLPELVQVRTGEEDEEVLFKQRCRLYRFTDGQWKERGIGEMKVLRRADRRCRLVMRREQVHKLCCNQTISEQIPDFKPLTASTNGVCWFAKDFSTEQEGDFAQFAIRFKLAKELDEFKECVTSCKAMQAGRSSGQGASSSEVNVAAQSSPADETKEVEAREEEEEEEEEEEVWFSALVTLTSADAANQAGKTTARGSLRLVLDDDVVGGRIRFEPSSGQRTLCNHIVTMETALSEDLAGRLACWTALDFSEDEPRRRVFSAVFNSADELQQFRAAFGKAHSHAVESELMERKDCEEVEVPERVG